MKIDLSLGLVLTALVVAPLAGCEACAADRRARAQPLDAGVIAAPAVTVSAPAVCYVAARERTSLLDDQVFQLCQGAPTPNGPVDCFVDAERRLMLTDAQRLLLCRCAPSREPVDCFEMLDDATFLLDEQIQQLCSPTLVRGLLPSCLPRAL